MRKLIHGLWLCVMACEPSMAPGDANSDASVVSDGGASTESCPVATGSGTRHSGRLSASEEVWSAAGNPHIIEFPVTLRMGETLTLEPCVEVRIERNDYLEIGDGARLVAEGTAARPIVIKRQDAEAWRNVFISGNADASLAYVTLEGGGADVSSLRISIDPNDNVVSQRTRVDHVTVRGSATVGVTLEGNAGFTADSRDLTITGSARVPLRTWQRAVGTIPSGSYTGNATDELVIESGGYGAYALRGDVTIHERGVPYHVVGGIRVGTNSGTSVPATLTIEPGVTLRLERNVDLEVRDGSRLVAEGTAAQPITIKRQDAEPWRNIFISGYADASLAYVTLEGGGADVSSLRISIDPNDNVASQRTRVDHVTVRGSATVGVTLEGNAGFTVDSRDLTITGSARVPLRTWQRAVGTIPSGSYTGNATDELVIENGGYGAYALRGDVTIHERGVPYHVVGGIRVGTSSGATVPATLTIEPGVTLRFDPNNTLSMQGTSSATGDSDLALGSLRAVGTAERPIVFTSARATPAAGDWGGLVFVGVATSQTRIEHAVISYAGGGNGIASASCGNGTGGAGDEAAVTITGWDAQPMSAFIANTRIEHSPRYGIVEGWRGTTVDFVSTNTFVDVASCWVSTPRTRTNSCPAMPVCQTSP